MPKKTDATSEHIRRLRQIGGGRGVDYERWVKLAVPCWSRLSRPMRVMLGMLPSYETLGAACEAFGYKVGDFAGSDAYSDWLDFAGLYYRDGRFGSVERYSMRGKGDPVMRDVTPHDVVVLLMYEHSLTSAGHVLLGNGSSEDYRLVREAGFMLPAAADALRTAQRMKASDDASDENRERLRRGGTGVPDPTTYMKGVYSE